MKRNELNFRKILMIAALVPLVSSLLLMAVFCVVYMRTKLVDHTRNTLQVAAGDLAEYYAYDLRNEEMMVDGWVTYDPDYMDHLKDQGVDLTLFHGDTRFCTSIFGDDGKRIEGTKASEAVVKEVIGNGKDYFSDDVVINGNDYYVYYVPLRDANNNVVGMAFAGETCERVNGALSKMMIVAGGIACMLILIFVCLCLYFARIVSKPLNECAETLTKLSEGNLNADSDTKSKVKETRAIIAASHLLKDKLNEILGEVKSVSEQLSSDANNVQSLSENSSSSVVQISSAVEDLADGANEMAENVQEIGKQVADLNDTIALLTESSEALAESSENIRKAGDEASEYISKVSDSSVHTVEAVDNITRQISDTNDAVQKIREAVDMITSIANQTNLLALNASIEAARAGEAGRGFAVVASEIGNLSDQSSKSANVIREIVEDIVRNSEASVKLSDNVARLIREEQGFISETQNKFLVLGKEIGESLEHIRQVSDDTVQLEKIQNIVTDAVQSLSAISQENAASNQEVSASITGIATSVDEIASSSDATKSNSEKLVNVISYFNC